MLKEMRSFLYLVVLSLFSFILFHCTMTACFASIDGLNLLLFPSIFFKLAHTSLNCSSVFDKPLIISHLKITRIELRKIQKKRVVFILVVIKGATALKIYFWSYLYTFVCIEAL